ncbi:MAG TPA: DUF4272 domain-containing protein [Actinomycetota bacterium]
MSRAVASPSVREVSDRALVLYAVVRRATIEHLLSEWANEPSRIAQAEAARAETDRWLTRESLDEAVTELERRLLAAPSGSWPAEAAADGEWRHEALGTLLWGLRHLEDVPAYDEAFPRDVVETAITRYGSVDAFRTEGSLRPDRELERAWGEADAWFAATEGSVGEDAALASTAVERLRALSWLRDASAPRP